MTLIVIYVSGPVCGPHLPGREGRGRVGADLGYVLSMDHAGPFEPDVDGNKYFLAGVEVAHTKLGFVELTRDRSAPEAVLSAKKMIRDLHLAGPDPKPLVRIHTDDDTSFKGEFKEYSRGPHCGPRPHSDHPF